MTHVCIFTSAHPLDDVRVYTKIATSFLEAGFDVSWVGPEVAFFAADTWRDPRIAYHLTPRFTSKPGRALSARTVMRKATEVQNVDWYYSPDPDAAAAANRLSRRTGARVLFDIHEIFHGALLDRWLPSKYARPIREIVRRRVAKTAHTSDLVIGVSDAVLRPYVRPGSGSLTVRNCAPRWFADRIADATDAEGGPATTFMHGKGLPTNGTPVLIEALARLGPHPPSTNVIIFPSTGKGNENFMPDLEQRIAQARLGDVVELHDAVTHEEMPGVLARCDVGLIAYGRGLGEDSLPNRLFEYMAAGMAILAPSYAVEIKRIIDVEQIGLVVDFDEPTDIAEAVRWFDEHPEQTREMGARAREAFLERHSWEAQFEGLLAAMNHN